VNNSGVSQSEAYSFSLHGDKIGALDSLNFLRSSKVLVGNFLVDKAGLGNVKLVLENVIIVLDVGKVGNNTTESLVLLVGETESGFVVSAESGKSGAFSSDGVKLIGKVSNLSGESGVLVGKDGNLVREVSNGGLSIGKSGLEGSAFGSDGVKLSGEISDGSREVGVLVGKNHNLVVKVSNGGFSIGKSGLKGRAFGSDGIELVGQVSDSSREVSILVSKHHNLVL